jgi:hypothetical protein
MSEKIPFAAIQARNKASSKLSIDPNNATKQEHLRKTRKTVKYIVKLVKAKNQEQFANNTLAKDGQRTPKKDGTQSRLSAPDATIIMPNPQP